MRVTDAVIEFVTLRTNGALDLFLSSSHDDNQMKNCFEATRLQLFYAMTPENESPESLHASKRFEKM